MSVSGTVIATRDRETIRQLYAEDWKAWFAKDGHPTHGTPDDPRIVLLGVSVHSAVFFESTKPQRVMLFELAKRWLTGTQPDVGTMHRIGR